MHITDVRIKLASSRDGHMLAYCSVTFDSALVVRDLKIIHGTRGPFVAMPDRKLTDHCVRCNTKNHLRAKYCNECGLRMNERRALPEDRTVRVKLYADLVHPISADMREKVQAAVIRAYEREKELAMLPGYVCTYDEWEIPSYGKALPDTVESGHA